jgi:diaminopropionate ammonia-lyase
VSRVVVNAAYDPAAVGRPAGDAPAFHAALPGYAPTPVRALDGVARELGLGAIGMKDESARFGLPAFKVLGASWAVERALRAAAAGGGGGGAEITTLVAASAGNHGRAVAHVAATRGLACRVFLPARSARARREAIAGEGAEVVVIDGTYEEAVAAAAAAGARPGALEIADVGDSGPARWVVDGYATLFAELAATDPYTLILVPIGVGSLGAAAARHGAAHGIPVVGVEPATAACLSASLSAGAPTAVPTPGTTMAGLDCAEVTAAVWPDLHHGIAATITVSDAEAHAAMAELAALGHAIGDCGAAPLAALRALVADPAAAPLRAALPPGALGRAARVLLVATEGVTDPDAYAAALGGRAPKSGRSDAPS